MMSDGSLSQEEIDALLESGEDVNVKQAGVFDPGMVQESMQILENILQSVLSEQQQALGKAINIRSSITYRTSQLTEFDSISGNLGAHAVQITRNISGADKKELSFILSEEDALKAATYIIGQEDLKVNDVLLNALQETIITISEPILTAIGESRNSPIEIESTTAKHMPVTDISLPNSPSIIATYVITMKSRSIELYMAIDPSMLDQLQSSSEMSAFDTEQAHAPMAAASAPAAPAASALSGSQSAPAMPSIPVSGGPAATSTVHGANFGQLTPSAAVPQGGNLGILMDVDMELTVELGRTRRQIRDILQLGEGSIIELDKLAGEPVDILVNHRLIAKGEVVVIDENFGVRITEVIHSMDSLENL